MISKTGWAPPAGMMPAVASEWRRFYAAALTKYGVTPTRYRAYYLAQHGCCYICRKAKGKHPDDPKGSGGRRLAIDHNHVTGRVRGLLCSGGDKTCNRVIGWLNHAALKRAVEYVEREPAQAVDAALIYIADVEGRSGEPLPDRDGFLKTVLGLT